MHVQLPVHGLQIHSTSLQHCSKRGWVESNQNSCNLAPIWCANFYLTHAGYVFIWKCWNHSKQLYHSGEFSTYSCQYFKLDLDKCRQYTWIQVSLTLNCGKMNAYLNIISLHWFTIVNRMSWKDDEMLSRSHSMIALTYVSLSTHAN